MAQTQQHAYDLWHYDLLNERNIVDEHGFSMEDYETLEQSLDKPQEHRKNKHQKHRITRQALDSFVDQRRWEKEFNDLFGDLTAGDES